VIGGALRRASRLNNKPVDFKQFKGSWLGLRRSRDSPGVIFELWGCGLDTLGWPGRRLQRRLLIRMGRSRRLPVNVVLQSLKPFLELDHALPQRPGDVGQPLAKQQDSNDPDHQQMHGLK
jgi:hypothetical protein